MSPPNPLFGPCSDCGLTSKLSRNGLCEMCSCNRVVEATRQLRAKSGPIYERWLARVKASLEKVGVS